MSQKTIESILVITPNYPIDGDPVYPFVKNICDQFTIMGHKVVVVSPQSITSSILHSKKIRPIEWVDNVKGKRVTIYQPLYISFPHKWHNINNFIKRLCLKFFFRRNRICQDVVYCHFWSSAYAVLPCVEKLNLPLFVASGESDIKKLFTTSYGLKKLKDYVNGVICVSSKNRDESIALGLTTFEKCEVFPNGVNTDLFHLRDRAECRQLLGLPQDAFIVIFVGWFIERKGVERVAKAISRLDGVNSIFIGKGNQEPDCEGILFKGPLSHDKIPFYLSAADVFVLPTLHEGCCNAVVEAMSCGLPIISSNLPFNWDILDETNSIMINPNNVDEISDAIVTLRDNPKILRELAEGAIKKAQNLTIAQRVKSIIQFMNNRMNL